MNDKTRGQPVMVASMVEDGGFYVVMAKTIHGRVPGRDPNIKCTTLTVSKVSTALGMAILDEGERVAVKEVFTQYVALPPTGGLFWEYAGRRLLEESVRRRKLTASQTEGYEARLIGVMQEVLKP